MSFLLSKHSLTNYKVQLGVIITKRPEFAEDASELTLIIVHIIFFGFFFVFLKQK